MNKTLIETADFSWNPITGCTNGCSFCYARKLAEGRLRKKYITGDWEGDPDYCAVDPFYPRFWPDRLHITFPGYNLSSKNPHLPDGTGMTFVCDMGDIFDKNVSEIWRSKVFKEIELWPDQVFQILTKQPDGMYSHLMGEYKGEYPHNVWAGVSAIDQFSFDKAVSYLRDIKASIKFLSVEPLIGNITVNSLEGIDWLIVGAQTKPLKLPNIHQVEHINWKARAENVPIFFKNSIRKAMWITAPTEFPRWSP